MHHVISKASHVLRPVTSSYMLATAEEEEEEGEEGEEEEEEEECFPECYLKDGSVQVHSK